MNKGMILDVAAETIGSEWARNRAALKKTELVAAAAAAFRPDPARDPARDAAATRWMPPGFEPNGVPSVSESVPVAAAAGRPRGPARRRGPSSRRRRRRQQRQQHAGVPHRVALLPGPGTARAPHQQGSGHGRPPRPALHKEETLLTPFTTHGHGEPQPLGPSPRGLPPYAGGPAHMLCRAPPCARRPFCSRLNAAHPRAPHASSNAANVCPARRRLRNGCANWFR